MYVTYVRLVRAGACRDYRVKFRRFFPVTTHPRGVYVSERTCVRYADEFDWLWAVERLLPGSSVSNVSTFDCLTYPAREEHYRVTAAAQHDGSLTTCPGCVVSQEASHVLHVAQARAFARMTRDPRLLNDPRHLECWSTQGCRVEPIQLTAAS